MLRGNNAAADLAVAQAMPSSLRMQWQQNRAVNCKASARVGLAIIPRAMTTNESSEKHNVVRSISSGQSYGWI
eukprot:11490983-Prorocentrum_lima.AAC.1